MEFSDFLRSKPPILPLSETFYMGSCFTRKDMHTFIPFREGGGSISAILDKINLKKSRVKRARLARLRKKRERSGIGKPPRPIKEAKRMPGSGCDLFGGEGISSESL